MLELCWGVIGSFPALWSQSSSASATWERSLRLPSRAQIRRDDHEPAVAGAVFEGRKLHGLWPVEFRELLLQPRPTVDIIVLQGFDARRVRSEMLRITGLEHEGQRIVKLVRLELDGPAFPKAVASGPCGSMQLCRLTPPGTKPSGLASYWP